MAYTSKTWTERKEIKKMHEAKLASWDKRELGMALGAAMNVAVEIALAVTPKTVGREKLGEEILYWRDWVFAVQQEKNHKEMAGGHRVEEEVENVETEVANEPEALEEVAQAELDIKE